MKRPSLLTRLMGARLIALVLLIACGVVFVGWFEGGAPWWLGFVALFTALQTLSSVGQVRRYKAWAAKWQAMGEPMSAPPRLIEKKRRHGWLPVIVAALLTLAIPVYVGDGSDMVSSALTCLWVAACLYLAFRFLRRVMRRGAKRREEKSMTARKETETPFVAWVMGRASSSPSRAEAERNLPEYSARVSRR